MKNNKTRIIVLSILFMALCILPIGFVYFSPNKYNIKDNNEEINLGAAMVVDDGAGGGGKSSSKDKGGTTTDTGSSLKSGVESWVAGVWDQFFNAIDDIAKEMKKILPACSAITNITFSGELSPDSTLYAYVTVASGYTGSCTVTFSYSNDGTSNSTESTIGVENERTSQPISLGGNFKSCTKVDVSATGENISYSAKINVKSKFSTDTKIKDLSGVDSIPSDSVSADKEGKSYYGECDDPKNCAVHTRDLCTESCHYNGTSYTYCYGNNCGEGYSDASSVKKSDCINVCYCNEEKEKCGIWAKKDWSNDSNWNGYEIIKDSNDNYITDSQKCVLPPKYSFCCVDNGNLTLSTKAEYKEKVKKKECPDKWTLLEDVSKDDCKIVEEELGSCNMSDISPAKQTGEANGCEEAVSITVDEGKKCTNTINDENTNFYEISCAKTVKTSFDYGNDESGSTVRTLYKGEGFAFKINVETTVNCKYTFYDTVWTNAYNGVTKKIEKIDSNLLEYMTNSTEWEKYINDNILNKNGVNDASELYRLWGIAEELRTAVKAYNEYKPNDGYKESSKITIETKEKGKNVVTTYELMKTRTDAGSYQTSEVSNKDLKVSGVTNPQSYNLSSKTPRKIVLMPKRACIDKSTGKIIAVEGSSCPANTLDGGNKIYINSATDVTTGDSKYPIKIKVEGLGANDSSVINNKCDLKVDEGKYIYRPIDVSNPFINSKWQKGKNWINEIFDFTKIIHSNTWSDNSNKKVITLTSKEIVSLKESNSRAWKDNNSPYMGLCDKQSITLQDEITKKLCSLIK